MNEAQTKHDLIEPALHRAGWGVVEGSRLWLEFGITQGRLISQDRRVPQLKAAYIDTWGRGTLKIFKACEEAGLPEPQILEKDGGIEVTLFKAISKKDVSERFRNDFGTISEQIRNKFGIQVEATFKIINEHPEYSAKQIAQELDVTSRTIENHQAKLKEAGYIERKGDNVGGYWQIIKI
jgi:ATP-dependent DNA helicase RecG